jgi:hypothetical protein
MFTRPIIFASVISTAVFVTSNASAEFNGEVLIAPPPPNWSGGAISETKDGTLQTWRRTFNSRDGVSETISIRRSALPDNPDIDALADTVSVRVGAICENYNETARKPLKTKIGSALSFIITCKPSSVGPKSKQRLYIRARVMLGEFNQYVVERTWRGDIQQPTSPINSPKTRASWQAFFRATSVCNTLISECSEERARNVHAHERFKNMRALPEVIRPIMEATDIQIVASKFGQLTGRAQACGEDITPLTSKVGRMFAHVSPNDQVSSVAVATFNSARETTYTQQTSLPREQCGEILRTFRSHPSRVGVFHNYAQRFL